MPDPDESLVSRRGFGRRVGAVSAGVFASSLASPAALAADLPPRPAAVNVLLILSDDQGPWAMGCAGNHEIRTPNLDRLAASGIRFENFFCASPVCSAARASLLTGRMPSQSGVHDWLAQGNYDRPAQGGRPAEQAIEYLRGLSGYSDILAAAGYRCALSGKWHLGDSARPQKSFTGWFAHPQSGVPYYNKAWMFEGSQRVDVPGYLTDAITDRAIRFIDDLRDGPFCCEVHYTAPHAPWLNEHPADLVASYDNCPFESCPDVPVHPWQVASGPRGTGQRRRELLKGYFAAVTAMDRGVGRLLDRLEALGLRQNTLVFFCSDNGMNMGHHGIFGKGNGTFPQNMYDTSVKVPAIISLPGRVPQGQVDRGLRSHYDWFPTLLDYLGLENPRAAEMPGRSFAPLLRGQNMADRDSVVVFDEYGPVRMIRDRRWKYIHRHPYGPHELYDLAEDPEETRNLAGEPAMEAVVRPLRAQLHEFFLRYSDRDRDGALLPVYGSGQVNLVGRAGNGAPAFNARPRYSDADGQPRPPDYRPPGL